MVDNNQIGGNMREYFEEEFEEVFTHDYYDGPLSGLCKIDNKFYWYECVDESIVNIWRQYHLYELSEEDLQYVIARDLAYIKVAGGIDWQTGIEYNRAPQKDNDAFYNSDTWKRKTRQNLKHPIGVYNIYKTIEQIMR